MLRVTVLGRSLAVTKKLPGGTATPVPAVRLDRALSDARLHVLAGRVSLPRGRVVVSGNGVFDLADEVRTSASRPVTTRCG